MTEAIDDDIEVKTFDELESFGKVGDHFVMRLTCEACGHNQAIWMGTD